MPLNLNFSFYEIVPYLGPVSVIDIGAAMTKDPPLYQPLVTAGHATVTGFEPDAAACAKLTAQATAGQRFYPYFIGDGTPGTYHEMINVLTGSLYPANEPLLRRFTELPATTQPKAQHAVKTHRLDDVLPDEEIDFLKIDVQGGELAVLRGAARLVSTALLIEVEVEFIPLYAGQPLFADVDTYLRSVDFQIHAIPGIAKYFYTPMRDATRPLAGINQVAWADAIYFPRFETIMEMPSERILKLAALLHDIYASVDLVLHLLKLLEDRDGVSPYARYAQRLGYSV